MHHGVPIAIEPAPMTDVAAFDFDGTLTRGGSVFPFLVAVAGRPVVSRAVATLAPTLALGALAGGPVADAAKERLFVAVLAGIPADRVDAVSRVFAERHVASRLRPDVERRLAWHRRRGDRVVIVSASPTCYVQVAGDQLGVDAVIATRLAVDGGGRLTGRYDGGNCRGEEKLRRLGQWRADHELSDSRLWAYGNSRGDLAMLAAADVGVNAGRLGRLGRLARFPDLRHT